MGREAMTDTIERTIAALREYVRSAREYKLGTTPCRPALDGYEDDLLALCDAAERGLRCPPREPIADYERCPICGPTMVSVNCCARHGPTQELWDAYLSGWNARNDAAPINEGGQERVPGSEPVSESARDATIPVPPSPGYGCHCDLAGEAPGFVPDGCVFDSGDIEDCIYAMMLEREGKGKTNCAYWGPITSNEGGQEDRPASDALIASPPVPPAPAAPAPDAVCDWHQDGEDSETWQTGCGHYFTIIDGTPTDNKFRHCCFCGHLLAQHLHENDYDDE